MTINDNPADLHIFFESRDWAKAHLIETPKTIIEFLEGDGISLKGKKILDFGTGDGLIALGLGHLIQNNIMGVDVIPINWDYHERLRKSLCTKKCDHTFDFTRLPSGTSKATVNDYDFVLSWSVVEHVENLDDYFEFAFESLKSGGILFLQTYPLWDSMWGHHLFEWLPPYFHLHNDFEQTMTYLRDLKETHTEVSIGKRKKSRNVDEILKNRSMSRKDLLRFAEEILMSCNKSSLGDIGNALTKSGLKISKVELYTSPTHIPNSNASFVQNVIEGVKLLAYKP